MCTTDIYPSVLADGTRTETREKHRCSAFRRNLPCEDVVFRHPTTYHTSSSSVYPPHTVTPGTTSSRHGSPRIGTPIYRSGDESERSISSNASRESRSRRRQRDSGIYISSPSSSPLGRKAPQRIVIVDGPPTPRTPPQTFLAPHTAPSSPNMSSPHRRSFSASSGPGQYVYTSSPSSDYLRPRPIIVDERPRPQHIRTTTTTPSSSRHPANIEIITNRTSTSTRRPTSSSSSEGRPRRSKTTQSREAEREKSLYDRIRAANSSISQRNAVPVPPRKPTVSFAPSLEQEQDLRDAMDRLHVSSSAAREREGRRREVDEEIAQRERLRERMMPRRRATVGPGSRRGKVVYGDGVYQWE